MHLPIANLNSFSTRLFIIVGIALLGINNAFAQQYSTNNRYGEGQRNANVIIYQDCNFRGAAQELAVGDYPNLKTMRLNNDSISSIKIPQGFEITFYQHDRFGGDSATASEDIACLNPQWNDQISSLRITADYRDQKDYRDNRDRRGGEQGQGNRSNRGNEDRSFEPRNQNNRNNPGNYGHNRASVNGNNLINVSYAASQLDYLQNGVWRQTNRRGRTINYAETSRDQNSVYMKSQNTDERVRIDLFSNEVTIVTQNGEQRRFPILDMRSGNVVAVRPTPIVPVAPVVPTPNRVIPSGCFNYKAYTLGGEGGIRFHGHDGFHRFQTKGHSDRICHDGALTMELNKTSPATAVLVEINGQTYRFDKNETPDTFLNTWYRKKITLKVGGR